jgi:hypothetical protein
MQILRTDQFARWHLEINKYDMEMHLYPIFDIGEGDREIGVGHLRSLVSDDGDCLGFVWDVRKHTLGQRNSEEVEKLALKIPMRMIRPLQEALNNYFGKGKQVEVLEAKIALLERHIDDLRAILNIKEKGEGKRRHIDL